eukprot:scaffold83722_cov69-Phaeocystis_antarctica.AAC.5
MWQRRQSPAFQCTPRVVSRRRGDTPQLRRDRGGSGGARGSGARTSRTRRAQVAGASRARRGRLAKGEGPSGASEAGRGASGPVGLARAQRRDRGEQRGQAESCNEVCSGIAREATRRSPLPLAACRPTRRSPVPTRRRLCSHMTRAFHVPTWNTSGATGNSCGDSRNRLGARGGNSPGRLGHQGGASRRGGRRLAAASRPGRGRLAAARCAAPLPRAPPLPPRNDTAKGLVSLEEPEPHLRGKIDATNSLQAKYFPSSDFQQFPSNFERCQAYFECCDIKALLGVSP